MRNVQLLEPILHRVRGLFQYRKVKTRLFAGRAIIEEISFHGGSESSSTLMIRYKNGLMLTVGQGGILDFQDEHFSEFMENEGFGKMDFLVHLHKVVLKSLLKYMIHPTTTVEQRERAAAAISNLWLAEGSTSTDTSVRKQILIPT